MELDAIYRKHQDSPLIRVPGQLLIGFKPTPFSCFGHPFGKNPAGFRLASPV